MSLHGARYCCAINCSNNSKTTVDIRTGKPVRFHKFPDPEKKSLSQDERTREKERQVDI